MPKEYTMPFQQSSMSWQPVLVRSGLQIGSGKGGQLMPLLPNFQVEDSPSIQSGVGGIQSGILGISGQRLTDNGTIAEFLVSVKPPKSAAERDRMVRIIGDQMGFALKVTLHPLPAFLPGVPIPVMHSMVEKTADVVTVLLKLPPDRLHLMPEEAPLLIPTNQDKTVTLTATCERLSFETLAYEVMRDAAGKPVKPTLTASTRFTAETAPLAMQEMPSNEATELQLRPTRFLVGDGSPMQVADILVQRPPTAETVDPPEIRRAVQCATHPLEMEFRVMKSGRELVRQTFSVSGDMLDVEVICSDPGMDWKGASVAYQVHNAGAFFGRTHFDTGIFSLENERRLTVPVARDEKWSTRRDSIRLEVKGQPFTAVLMAGKTGWKPFDEDLSEWLPDAGASPEERLSGAMLEVTARAEFMAARGELSLALDKLMISDLSGRLRINDEEIAGSWRNGVLAFQCPGTPVPGKTVPLEIILNPDEYVRESLEETHGLACRLDQALDREVRRFGGNLLRMLADTSESMISASIDALYDKLEMTETFFSKALILKKNLDIVFDLRELAAKQVIDNLVGLLVEIASSLIELGVRQGSLLNSESLSAQERLLWKNQVRQGYEATEAAAKQGVEQSAARIAQFDKTLARLTRELETSEQFLKTMERDMAGNASESLAKAVKEWRSKAALQGLSIKKIPERIAEYQTEIRRLEMLLKRNSAAKGVADAEIEKVLKELRGEIGLLYTAGREGAEEVAKGVFSYDSLAETLSSASEALRNSLFAFIDGFSRRLREEPNVNPVVNEPYRSQYATHADGVDVRLPETTTEEEAETLSGGELTALVRNREKPRADWNDSQLRKWTRIDRQQKKEMEQHLRTLATRWLNTGPEMNDWVHFSNGAFRQTTQASDALIRLIRQYETAFSSDRPIDPSDNATWQNVDNLINSMSFWAATLVRLLSGVALLTGIGAPEALLLSKTGDLIDLLGASAQVAVAAHLTLPELNGIAEAAPLLASMMHAAGAEEGLTFEEPILEA